MTTRSALATLLAATTLITTVGCTSTPESETTEEPSAGSSAPVAPPNPGTDDGYTGPSLVGLSSEDFDVEVISDELNYPWEVQLADDAFVITEVEGTIVMINEGGLERYELQTSDPVVHDGGSGLLGIELSEDFAESGIAYVYYSYADGDGLSNRVAEVTFDGESWTETNSLVEGIPGHQLYNGGRVSFGPDGHLYVTTGWISDPEMARDISSLGGKILRMDTEGNPIEGNAENGSLVYSLGHRNPQGLDWNPDGELFVAEHGESANDEINQIEAGGDYGWPTIEGDETQEGLVAPYLHSGSETWAPSGAVFAGEEFVFTALRGTGVYVLNEEASAAEMIFTSDERVRAVQAEGESLYITTTNASPRTGGTDIPDRLLRITPTG